MKTTSLAAPALILGVVSGAFALLSVTPTFIGLLITPMALLLSLGSVALAHIAASRTEQSTRAAMILSYAALAVTVGWFMFRTIAATM